MALPKTAKVLLLILLLATISFSALAVYVYIQISDDCLDTDTVETLDSAAIDGKMHTLVLRQSGFHDKVDFLLLYAEPLEFDDCGKIENSEIAHEVIEYGPEDGPVKHWPARFEIRDKKILVHYAKPPKQRKPLAEVPVSWN